MSALPVHRAERPEHLLTYGPNRSEYLARFTPSEWELWMAIGGMAPARVREGFASDVELERKVSK